VICLDFKIVKMPKKLSDWSIHQRIVGSSHAMSIEDISDSIRAFVLLELELGQVIGHVNHQLIHIDCVQFNLVNLNRCDLC
jgi:hypothetical protein